MRAIDSLDNIPAAVLPPGLAWATSCRSRRSGRRIWEWRTTGHIGKFGFKPRVDASFQPTTFFDATNTR